MFDTSHVTNNKKKSLDVKITFNDGKTERASITYSVVKKEIIIPTGISYSHILEVVDVVVGFGLTVALCNSYSSLIRKYFK